MSARTVVVTGAAGGIGRCVADAFYAQGAQLVLADLDQDAVTAFAASLDRPGHRTLAVRLDAASSASNAELVTAAVARFGRIDHLVLGAGIYPDGPVAETTDDQWRQCLAVNLDGAFYLVRAAIPHIADGGSIVAITSLAGERGSRNHAHYAASKGAMLSFVRSLAWELGPNVRANAVAPGVIDTAMTRGLRGGHGEHLISSTPLARFGRPEEVAGVVRFLCGEDASFITGEVIQVNGGIHMQ